MTSAKVWKWIAGGAAITAAAGYFIFGYTGLPLVVASVIGGLLVSLWRFFREEENFSFGEFDGYERKFFSTPEEAARHAMENIVPRRKQDCLRKYELAEARLSKPIHEHRVDFKPLTQFELGGDVEQLLEGTDRLFYPVVVEGEGRAILVISCESRGWRFEDFSNASLGSEIEKRRKEQLSKGGNRGGFTVVTVPSLKVALFGFKVGNDQYVTCLAHWPDLSMGYGETYTVEMALLRLKQDALKRRGGSAY